MHRTRRVRALLAAVTLLPALVGCGGSESRSTSTLSGTWTREQQIGSAESGSAVNSTTLTLTPDNRFSMTRTLTMNGASMASGTDSGTWAVQGATLALNTQEQGVLHYTISGDTLWRKTADQQARATAVTGLDAPMEVEDFLVRRP